MLSTGILRRSIAWLAVLFAAFGLISGGAAAAAAPPDPVKPVLASADLHHSLPAGFTSAREFQDLLNRLRQAATRLSRTTEGLPGFTGIELSVPNRSVNLYWHGTPPSDVGSLIAAERSQARIIVKPARYSHQQLAIAANRVVKAANSAVGSPIVRVSLPVDGHALEVGAQHATRQSTRAAATVAAGDVAVVVSEEKPKIPLYGRTEDTPPFWGGARITNVNTGGSCSSGFGIRRNATGATAMLSAAHCGAVGNTFTNGLGTRTLGPAIDRAAQPDTLVISTAAAAMVYDGDAWSNSARPVKGTAPNFIGDYMCTLGAFSGGICDVVVVGVDEFVTFGSAGLLGPLVRAHQLHHSSAAGQGDSGGPVISLTGPDWSQLMANGTIIGGDLATEAGCTGEGNRICSWRLYYADVNLALARHNASVLTG